MSGLRQGWASFSLDELVFLKTGPFGSALHKSDYVSDGIPLVNPMHIVDCRISPLSKTSVNEETARRLADYRLKVGDVVLGRRGEMGRCAVVSDRESGWLCGTGSLIVRPDSAVLCSDFLQKYLSSDGVVRYLESASVGSTMANLNQDHLLELAIDLPPLNEQTCIVAKLEELLSDLDAGVAELKAAQRKLALYRQSLLKAAVEGALTADWRARNPPTETGAQLLARILERRRARWETRQLARFKEQGKMPPKGWRDKYPEPASPEVGDLPTLPEAWTWASVDQCSLDDASVTDGPFGSNLKSAHYQESGPRVIRLQNIGDGVFLDARAHISESHFRALAKHSVEAGDVIIAMLGEVLPRACMAPSDIAPAIVKADCARVRLNPDVVSAGLLVSQLNSKPVRDIVARYVKGIGRPRVNLGHIRRIPVALAPLEEQSEIVAVLGDAIDAIDNQLQAIELGLKQSTAQRKNILRAAFAGQLVPQDPTDEPASVLLARIGAERAAQAGKATSARGRRKAAQTV